MQQFWNRQRAVQQHRPPPLANQRHFYRKQRQILHQMNQAGGLQRTYATEAFQKERRAATRQYRQKFKQTAERIFASRFRENPQAREQFYVSRGCFCNVMSCLSLC